MRALTLALAVVSTAIPGAARAEDRSRALAEQALGRNPSVAALEARIAALEEQVQRAGVWSDPVVAIEYSNIPVDSWALGDHPMSGLQFKLQQTFPFFGKTRLRQEVARAEVKQQRHLLAERRLQLAGMVRRAYHSLALTRQLRRVTGRHIALLGQLIDVVRVRYEVGKVEQHDLLRLTVLRDRLADDLEGFDRDDRALTASINAALHRRAALPIMPIKTPERTSVSPPPESLEALVRVARSRRPALALLEQQARTEQARARQARREKYPDITAWAGYRVRTEAGADPGTDFVALGLSLPLTLFQNDRRWGSVQRAARARARAAEAERDAELDSIRGALAATLASWRRAVRQARAYRARLMPGAQRTLDATLAAYQVDRADFASLVQAELQLLEFERTVRRAEAAAALAEVEVETLVGRPVSRDERSR
jgi:cobalt-zinc-cadmium efflux system outer membrane protein